MRSQALQRVLDTALEMLIQRLLAARLIFVRDHLVQDAPIAGLLDVSRHAQHQPQRIVVKIAADRVVPALGKRLVLVVRAACLKLRGGDVKNPLARSCRDHVHETEHILVGIAEAHPAPDARFEQRGRARQIERDHVLVGVPDVHHPVGMLVWRFDLENAEQIGPVVPQCVKGGVGVGGVEIARDDRLNRLLIDRL